MYFYCLKHFQGIILKIRFATFQNYRYIGINISFKTEFINYLKDKIGERKMLHSILQKFKKKIIEYFYNIGHNAQ